jgi:hypothetical protein
LYPQSSFPQWLLRVCANSICCLYDAAYSGDQLENNTLKVQSITGDENQVIVANLATYQKAYARTKYIDGMQITSAESMQSHLARKMEWVDFFFYKQADSTPKFIKNFLSYYFGVRL